ncbi:MAG: leucine-rich repeat protein [Treponema sp.]|uniref:leucine-rich repeat protein n=1 Tax=Treponema sp. TaxID=166 RepID=UPI003FA27330
MCSNCTDLTDIEFPHGLEEIGKQAFLDCRNLTNIKLPATLRSIGMETCYKKSIS